MPPPKKIPPIFIPTPKGWWEHHVQQPHVIPPKPVVANQCLTLQLQSSKQKYAYAASQIAAQEFLAQAVMDEEMRQALEYRHLLQSKHREVWQTSCTNEFGRLAQGVGSRIKTGTNTIFFINKEEMPADRKATYACFVVDVRPQKKETHRTRLKVGGNLIDYPGNVCTPTADIDSAKLLFNSVVSTPNKKICTIDIKNFYLNTPMT
eukprot:3782513-Ditylum_brightwellii.AAC.1